MILSKQKSGFTLIELLVVIFIIGILAAVLFPNFVGSRQRARDATRKHDLVEIKNALRLYYNDFSQYPDRDATSGEILACGVNLSNPPTACSWGSSWTRGTINYMQVLPDDPSEGLDYGYCPYNSNNGFLVWSKLENQGDPDGAATPDATCGTLTLSVDCSTDLAAACTASSPCYFVCAN